MRNYTFNTLDVSDVSQLSIYSVFKEYFDYFTDVLDRSEIEFYVHSEEYADTAIIIVKPEYSDFMEALIKHFNSTHDVRIAKEDFVAIDDLDAFSKECRNSLDFEIFDTNGSEYILGYEGENDSEPYEKIKKVFERIPEKWKDNENYTLFTQKIGDEYKLFIRFDVPNRYKTETVPVELRSEAERRNLKNAVEDHEICADISGLYALRKLSMIKENPIMYNHLKESGRLKEYLDKIQKRCEDFIETQVNRTAERLREQETDILSFDREIKQARIEAESEAMREYVCFTGFLYHSADEYTNAEREFMEKLLSYVIFIYDYKDAIYHECDNDLENNAFCIDDLSEGFLGDKYETPVYYMDISEPEDRMDIIDEILEQTDTEMFDNFVVQLGKHGSKKMVEEFVEAVKEIGDADLCERCVRCLCHVRGDHHLS